MAEMEGSDEVLRQDLVAFGEKVDKITDKNREILVKKLNHLRARKRMSEKLSASMLESPKRGGAKGRGKKVATAKEVSATVIGTPEELVDKRLSVSLARNDAVVEPVASRSLMVEMNLEDEAAPPVKKGRGGRTSTRVTKKTAAAAADDQGSEASTDVGKVAGTRGRKKAGGDGTALNETLVVEVNEVNDERLVKCIDSNSMNVASNNPVAVKRGRASVAATRKAAGAVEKPKGRKTIANDVTIPLEDNSALRDGRSPSASASIATALETVAGRRGSYTVARSSPAAGDSGKAKAATDDHGKTVEEAKAVSRIPTFARASTSIKPLTPEICPSPKLTFRVFDTTLGRPAVNMLLILHYEGKVGSWTAFGCHTTDSEGKYVDFAGTPMRPGTYRLHCDTGAYYHSTNTRCSYPYIDIVFNVTDTSRSTNLELLLSPFSYTFAQTSA